MSNLLQLQHSEFVQEIPAFAWYPTPHCPRPSLQTSPSLVDQALGKNLPIKIPLCHLQSNWSKPQRGQSCPAQQPVAEQPGGCREWPPDTNVGTSAPCGLAAPFTAPLHGMGCACSFPGAPLISPGSLKLSPSCPPLSLLGAPGATLSPSVLDPGH